MGENSKAISICMGTFERLREALPPHQKVTPVIERLIHDNLDAKGFPACFEPYSALQPEVHARLLAIQERSLAHARRDITGVPLQGLDSGYWEQLPVAMQSALTNFFEHRLPPGGVLRRVLENNVMSAWQYADDETQSALRPLLNYLYWHAPANAFGSPAKVAEWLAKGPL